VIEDGEGGPVAAFADRHQRGGASRYSAGRRRAPPHPPRNLQPPRRRRERRLGGPLASAGASPGGARLSSRVAHATPERKAMASSTSLIGPPRS
jgi:hypothetical protein